ncbi:hypothetical protein EYS14_06490 [Alteromonadaceae bacterium M269]|nr:hypothetical protein EYS14_06490 [Alteromonadaceae bacterium M269]
MENQSKTDVLLMQRKSDKEKSLKLPFKISSLRVFLLGFVATVATYTHFFGVSYFSSKMSAAGFEGVVLDLTTGQSLYYALEGYNRGLVLLMESIMSVNPFIGVLSVFVGGGIFYGFRKKLFQDFIGFFLLRPLAPNEQNNTNPEPKTWWVITKNVLIAIFSIAWSYYVLFFTTFFSIILIGLFVAFMSLGKDAGTLEGNKLVSPSLCRTIDWEGKDKEIDKVLGCRISVLNNGLTLTGVRLYKSESTEYLVTNDGAYEISNGQIVTCRAFNFAPSEKKRTVSKCRSKSGIFKKTPSK